MARLKTLVVSLKSAHIRPEALPPDSTINLRADLAGDIDPARLRRNGSDRLLYGLRSPAQNDGGAGDCDAVPHRRLLALRLGNGESRSGQRTIELLSS